MITRSCRTFLSLLLVFPAMHGCSASSGSGGVPQAGATSTAGGGSGGAAAGAAGVAGTASGGSAGSATAGQGGNAASGAGDSAGNGGGSAGGGAAGAGIESECTAHSQCGMGMRCLDQACAPLAQATEACRDDVECVDGTECLGQACTPVGGLNQACASLNMCDDTLICKAQACVESVMVRFCHCIFFNNGATDASLTLTLYGYEFPPVLSETCSECVAFPKDTELDYLIEVAGDAKTWTGNYTPGGEEDGLLIVDAGGPAAYAAPCDMDLAGLCGG